MSMMWDLSGEYLRGSQRSIHYQQKIRDIKAEQAALARQRPTGLRGTLERWRISAVERDLDRQLAAAQRLQGQAATERDHAATEMDKQRKADLAELEDDDAQHRKNRAAQREEAGVPPAEDRGSRTEREAETLYDDMRDDPWADNRLPVIDVFADSPTPVPDTLGEVLDAPAQWWTAEEDRARDDLDYYDPAPKTPEEEREWAAEMADVTEDKLPDLAERHTAACAASEVADTQAQGHAEDAARARWPWQRDHRDEARLEHDYYDSQAQGHAAEAAHVQREAQAAEAELRDWQAQAAPPEPEPAQPEPARQAEPDAPEL